MTSEKLPLRLAMVRVLLIGLFAAAAIHAATETLAFTGSQFQANGAGEVGRPRICKFTEPSLVNTTGKTSFAFDTTCLDRRLTGHVELTYPSAGLTGAFNGRGGFDLASPINLGLSADFTATGAQIGTISISPDSTGTTGKNTTACIPYKVGRPPVATTGTCSLSTLDTNFFGDPGLDGYHLEVSIEFNDGFERIIFPLRIYYAPAQPDDLGDGQFSPGPDPTACAVPHSEFRTSRLSPRATSYPHMRARAGNASPVQASVQFVCSTPACNIAATLTYKTVSGGNWFKMDPVAGNIKTTSPFTANITADASKLAPGSYIAEFTLAGNFKSSPLVREVVLDVLDSAIKFVPGSFIPDTKRGIDPTEQQIASVTYDFTGLPRSRSNLSLRLYDKASCNDRQLLGSSDFVAVSQSDSPRQKTLTIDPSSIKIPKEMANVYLVAALVDTETLDETEVAVPVVPGLKPKIEVVQVTQDADGAVAMINGRETLVRVFPQQQFALSNLVKNVTATVTAQLVNDDGTMTALSAAPEAVNSPITAAEKPVRAQQDSSLNFLVPSDWFDNANTYSILITAQIKPPDDRPDNPKYAKGSSKATFLRYWSETTPYRIGYFPLCYMERSVAGCPTSQISQYDRYIKMLYPFPLQGGGQSGYKYSQAFTYYLPPWPEKLVGADEQKTSELQKKLTTYIHHQWQSLPNPPNKLVAWLPKKVADDQANEKFVGSSDPQYAGGMGRAAWIVDRGAINSDKTLAHEIGHNLALRHTGVVDEKRPCSPSQDFDTSWSFYFHDSKIQDPGFVVQKKAIGRFFEPDKNYDLMGYCPALQTFIAPFHYGGLINGLLTEWLGAGFAPNSAASKSTKTAGSATPSDYLLIMGSVTQDGSSGQLDPAYRTASTMPGDASDPKGSHCIRFGSAGASVPDFCFTPSFVNENAAALSTDYFTFKIRYVAGVSSISLVLKKDGEKILSSANSTGPPTVQIQKPAAGATLSDKQTIEWTASDPGGAALTYRVQISNDGGATWSPLTYNLTGTQFTFDSSLLLPGDTYLRVIAMNGVESASDMVGPLKVSGTPLLSLPATPIDFGNVTIGTLASQSLTVTNPGNALLSITSVVSDNPAFSSPATDLFVPSDLPGSVEIDFQPVSIGPAQANISVNGSATVLARGVAFDRPVPSITLSPGTLDFGLVQGGQNKELSLVIGNTGSADLNITGLNFGDAQYSVVSPAVPFLVAPGDTASATVRFQPNRGGSATDKLTVVSNDPSRGSVPVSLTGSGTSLLRFSGGGVDGNGTLNFTQAATLQVTASNLAAAAVTVTSIQSSNSVFTASPQTFTVQPNGSAAFNVGFAPKASGTQQGILTFNLAGGGSATLNVAGTAAIAPPSLSTATTLNFGDVQVGANPPKTVVLAITNKGGGTLTLQSLNISGAGYRIVTAPSLPYNLGDTPANITLGFSPTAAGTGLTGTLTIGSNDPNSPTLVSLTGNGTAPSGGSTVQLAGDDGTYELFTGFPAGAPAASFVVRLTPPSYPATLRSVQIAFFGGPSAFAAGAPIAVVTGVNPTGSVNINNIQLRQLAATVLAVNAFNSYNVTPVTITSGDFIVGFAAANPVGFYPAALDTSSGSKGRSYLSPDGVSFTLTDAYVGIAGNLGIRATVDLGSGGGAGAVQPGTASATGNVTENASRPE